MINSVVVKGKVFTSSGKSLDINDVLPFHGRELYRFGPWHSDAIIDVRLGHFMGGNASAEVAGRNGRILSELIILYRRNGEDVPPESLEVGKPYEIAPHDVVQIIGPKNEGVIPYLVISPEQLASTNNRSRR